MAKAKPIKVGVAGLGRAGWGMHCGGMGDRKGKFKIVAVCDPIEERRQMATEKFGCAAYCKMEDMIADPEVELATIATRSTDHFPLAMMALKAGKHVYVEKPMCLTYDQAKKLKAAAGRSAGSLFVGHNRRFDPDFLHVREIIESGILGDVFQIKLARLGFDRRNDWQTLQKFGGGQLLNWGPHIIDHALQFLDAPVKSIWGDLKLMVAAGNAEDHLKIVLKGRNGRIVDLEISGAAAARVPEHVVWGSRGALTCNGSDIAMKYIDPKQKLAPRKPNPGTPGMAYGSPDNLKWIEKTIPVKPGKTYDIWDELHKTLRKGSTFPITIDQAVEVMRVISEVKKGTKF